MLTISPLSFVLLKQPVLPTLDSISHEPCGAVVAASEVSEQQVVALAAPQIHRLSLQRVRRCVTPSHDIIQMSATGNTKAVAEEIARQTDADIMLISTRLCTRYTSLRPNHTISQQLCPRTSTLTTSQLPALPATAALICRATHAA